LLLLLPHAINGAESAEEKEEKIPDECGEPFLSSSGSGTIACFSISMCGHVYGSAPKDGRLLLTGAALLRVDKEGRIEEKIVAYDVAKEFRKKIKKKGERI
ncbi:hypothetical protein PMAYCL1PPCAC_14672, partial [Pristionchus mayeri]